MRWNQFDVVFVELVVTEELQAGEFGERGDDKLDDVFCCHEGFANGERVEIGAFGKEF